MRFSVIIPAYNEEHYLEATVATILAAERHLERIRPSDSIEVIVVDNDSEDRTGELAARLGCRVIAEQVHNIGRVRNTGAREADGDVLIFIDADTLVPQNTFELIAERMDGPNCIGGAVDVDHKPAKLLIRVYLFLWRFIAKLTGMAQGASQFWRRAEFLKVGGYDEGIFMGEDVEFYWKMKRHARQSSNHVALIDEVRVVPSARKFDQWSILRTFVKTNPIYILLYRRTKSAWAGWYEDRPK